MGGKLGENILQQNCIILHGILSEVIPTTQYISQTTGKPYYLRRIILSGIGDLDGNTICLSLPQNTSMYAYSSLLGQHVVCYIHCTAIFNGAKTNIVNRMECWYIERYVPSKVYPFNQMQISQARMQRYMARMRKKMEEEPVQGVRMDDEGYAIIENR